MLSNFPCRVLPKNCDYYFIDYMKILYYSPHPLLSIHSPSGYGTHMREMIRAFESVGHEVFPLIMGDENKQNSLAIAEHRQTKGVVKRALPSVVWESMKDYALLRKDKLFVKVLSDVLVKEQPDLIYERANYLQLSGVNVAAALGMPHILEINAPYVEERRTCATSTSIYEQQANVVEKKQISRTGRAVVVSKALRDHFVEKHRISPRKFTVVPNAVDPVKMKPDMQRVSDIVLNYELQGKFVIGFVGSLFKWHGVDRLIRAFKVLSNTHPNIVLLVVGDGEIMPELQVLSASLEIEARVVFTGNVPHKDVANFIETMQITVLPNSHWYGSPVKIFEYGAMGKPIVAIKNWPVREVMVPNEDGLLIRTEKELVHQLERLIANPALRQKIARAFQQKVLKEHTWVRNVDRVLQHVDIQVAYS